MGASTRVPAGRRPADRPAVLSRRPRSGRPRRRTADARVASRPRRARLVGLLVVTAAMAVAGVVVAVSVLGGLRRPGLFDAGTSVPVSFGVVSVDHAERLGGLTSRELGGVDHGIKGLVPSDRMQVQATVSLTNLRRAPVPYTPRQFRLRVGRAPAVGASSGTMAVGRLQPHASLTARLSFVVRRSDVPLRLEFRDAGRRRPVLIRLGRLDRLRPAPDASHRHP